MSDHKVQRDREDDREDLQPGEQPSPQNQPVGGDHEDREELRETSFADESEESPLSEEAAVNFTIERAGANDEGVINEISRFTDDEDVLDDFSERQQLNAGSEKLFEDLVEHHSLSPDLSGEDIDAAWYDSNVSGEESVGGTVPTPDQDVVEELGEAVGVEYDDDEPLDTFDKLSRRDSERYELNVESMGDMAGEQVPEEDTPFAADIDKERRLEEIAGASRELEFEEPELDLEERVALSQDDSLDKDIDAIGDASFPQDVGDEDDDEEDYL